MVLVHATTGWLFIHTYRTTCVPAATLIAGFMDLCAVPLSWLLVGQWHPCPLFSHPSPHTSSTSHKSSPGSSFAGYPRIELQYLLHKPPRIAFIVCMYTWFRLSRALTSPYCLPSSKVGSTTKENHSGSAEAKSIWTGLQGLCTSGVVSHCCLATSRVLD